MCRDSRRNEGRTGAGDTGLCVCSVPKRWAWDVLRCMDMSKRNRPDELQRVMTTPVLTLTTRQAASDAWALMHLDGVRHAVVLRGKVIVGVISDRDLGGLRGGRARRGRTVADLMHEGAITATRTTTVSEAAALVRAAGIGCLPVVERGRLVGIVTRTDLLAWLTTERGRARTPRRRRSAEGLARPPVEFSPNLDKHP